MTTTNYRFSSDDIKKNMNDVVLLMTYLTSLRLSVPTQTIWIVNSESVHKRSKGPWLSCMLCFIVFLSLSHVVWYLIISIPDLCLLT